MIRSMVAADGPYVLNLECEANSQPWVWEHFEAFLSEKEQFITGNLPVNAVSPLSHAIYQGWVLENKQIPSQEAFKGFLCFSGVGDEIEIQNLAIHASQRRQGLASSLLMQMIAWAEAAQYRIVHLEARAGNSAALAFYDKLGFKQTGLRKGYYSDKQEDAVLMSLRL